MSGRAPILPGAMLGVLGGGQLGRMFVHSAQAMGYRVTVLDPDPHAPAGAAADRHLCAAYDDAQALDELAATCAAVTTEFENVPANAMRRLAQHTRVAPSADAVAIAQDRIREKHFFRDAGLGVVPFAVLRSAADITPDACAGCLPGILKIARLGYDGKGQVPVATLDEVRAAFASLTGVECILEKRVDLACEVSVVLARGDDGAVRCFPVGENQHRQGILDLTIVPARVAATTATTAVEMATRLANALGYVGTLGVELFVLRGGEVLVNEIAPRPHNSGHYTQDATFSSQFDQQVRALCGLPLGDPGLMSPVAMLNVMGDMWAGGTPDWPAVLAHDGARLHLYGKKEARPGRKMGHINVLARDADAAAAAAEALRGVLGHGAAGAGAAVRETLAAR
ncbi:MAG: 5-(carboxyamino)imidazole ribonucleotide synthase [Rhodocyclaceae bacterium]|nr:5-(carboxyamino)imidazole ribonucleotide synthase [Rhodocyclaceae bacterium]